MLPGDLVASRFQIEHLADSGGMGVVYRAIDLQSGRPVALKFVASGERSQQRRFVQEAAMLETLEHPGIVRHVAHGLTSQETFYLAMEWLEGEGLRARLRRAGLTPTESVRLITIVAKAAGFAHARGVVHRDFKPSNIFLEHGLVDDAKVIDFGIARHADFTEGLTIPGVAIGTPGYMAPEQASAGREIDARADIFSLGCVLFECLTGRKAFIANSLMALHAKILMEDPPRLRELGLDLPLSLDDLLARMLAKDPTRRPADGASLAAELAELTAELATIAPEIMTTDRMGIAITPPSFSSAALTRGEQRLMAVILVDPAGSVCVARASDDDESDVNTAPKMPDQDPNADLVQIADEFGGRLEVMVGGSLVATLMGGGAATDQAAQAARCALALRTRRPAAQIALAMGRGQITGRWPVGDVIDRAARVLRQSRAGDSPPVSRMNLCGILLDEVTAGLLDMRFEVARAADGAELRGEGELAKGARKLLGRPTPCVGREGELAVLDSLWNQCVSASEACVALITGPPGIGKSRLLHEFLTRLEKRGESFELWYGQSDPMRTSSPFGVIAPALRRAAGVIEGEPGDVKQEKLRARVAQHVSEADAPLVAEFMGEIAGVPFPHEQSVQLAAARRNGVVMADQRRRAWESFLTAECSAHPVLIVLEDLQWADDPTVKLIDAALRRCAELRWMVIALARPELEQRVSNLLAGRRVHSFNLFELSRKASEKLIRSVLGADVKPDTVNKLVERAAGNPFYLEELLRAVADGKGETLPGTVLAMLHARIESMGTESRRMLRAASIFGKTFWKGGLMALLGSHASSMTNPIDETRADVLLAQIEETEVIVRSEESRFSGEEEYAFRHALLQDAAYSTLTPEDRALGHRLAGEWLELTGEREAGVLAEHFDRGEDPERALIWYHRAGEQALLGGDLRAALAWAERGLAVGAEGTVRGTWK